MVAKARSNSAGPRASAIWRPELQLRRRRLGLSQRLRLEHGVRGIPQHPHSRRLGTQLTDQLELLADDVGGVGRAARDIAARPREARDQAGPHRISHTHHHDGDGARRLLRRQRSLGHHRHEHIDLEGDELRGERGEALEPLLGSPVLDGQVLSFRVTEPAQLPTEDLLAGRLGGHGEVPHAVRRCGRLRGSGRRRESDEREYHKQGEARGAHRLKDTPGHESLGESRRPCNTTTSFSKRLSESERRFPPANPPVLISSRRIDDSARFLARREARSIRGRPSMSFESLGLPALLRGVEELGYTEPTPIQQQAIPPGWPAGPPGLRHDRQRQDRRIRRFPSSIAWHRGRRRRRARWCSRRPASWPRRSTSTSAPRATRAVRAPPSTAASGWSRRSGLPRAAWTSSSPRPAACSTTCSTRTRAWPASRCWSWTRRTACWTWASCPTSAASSAAPRAAPDAVLLGDDAGAHRRAANEMLQRPGDDQHAARRRPRRHHADRVPGARRPQVAPAPRAAQARRDGERDRLHADQAPHNRLADFLVRHGVAAARIHGNRSQAQRTRPSPASRPAATVLVATDIAARGIDVEGCRTW